MKNIDIQEEKNKILKGLEKVYERLIEFKKQKTKYRFIKNIKQP